jgi:hypothetical protein
MKRTNTKLLIAATMGLAFHVRPIEPFPYAALPKQASWEELNRGKRSKKERRK